MINTEIKTVTTYDYPKGLFFQFEYIWNLILIN